MRNADFFDIARNRFHAGMIEFGRNWGWYLALGVFLVVIGFIAAGGAFATTLISVAVLGGILILAGAALVVLSFLTARWSGFLLTLAAGILSIMTGIMLLRSPLAGAASLTLIISGFLIVTGIYRAIASIAMRFPNWGWSLLSGIVSFALGSFLAINWPLTSLWFLGLYVGIDLMVHGFAWIMFSSEVHSLLRAVDRTEEPGRRAA